MTPSPHPHAVSVSGEEGRLESISRDDLLRRGDVIDLLQQRASEAADYVLYGLAENARTREAQEAAFKAAQYAVAFMPAHKPSPPRGESTAAGGWLPIESAPKDGTFILIFSPDDPPLGPRTALAACQGRLRRWYGVDDLGLTYDSYETGVPQPTHWMPLPPPPAAGQDLSEGVS